VPVVTFVPVPVLDAPALPVPGPLVVDDVDPDPPPGVSLVPHS
jgi:hypothetical protein